MFELHKGLKFYLCRYPLGNRGITGLSNIICAQVPIGLLSGAAFVFFNKSRKMVKILRWDEDGFILYQKTLQRGRFELPSYCEATGSYELSWDTFSFMMRGVVLESVKMKKRFRLPSDEM